MEKLILNLIYQKSLHEILEFLRRFLNQRIKTIKGIKSRLDVSSFIDVYKYSHVIKFTIAENGLKT